MTRWWGNFVKDYLTFTRKERNGIFVILLLCVAGYLVFRFLPVNRPHVDKGAFQKELAELKISIDTSRASFASRREDISPDYYRPKRYDDDHAPSEGVLFAFDPNTLDLSGWKRLGLRDKTINTIHNFLAKGYRFKQPDDLRKIYGLRSIDADRLIPYVKISANEAAAKTAFENHNYPSVSKKPEAERYKIIDVNTADTAQLIALPGIGSKLAARIVNFRQKLGGFTSVNQVAETYGVPDSTFQRIKNRLQCNNPEVKKININTADANELKSHPYIRWNLANAIVNYRNQHGAYKSLDDLRKIDIVTDDVYNKIAPYVML